MENKIKSERAVHCMVNPIKIDGMLYYQGNIVTNAIILAEQDTEEQILKVVAEWLKETYHDFAVDEDFIPEIKRRIKSK